MVCARRSLPAYERSATGHARENLRGLAAADHRGWMFPGEGEWQRCQPGRGVRLLRVCCW